MSSDNSNRHKRLRLSSEENANNYSFVRNVTSRVTGLLPSTITKWFSSPSSSNTNGSAASDTTDSSSDDEAIEIPVIVQPPAKKMRFYSPSNLDNNEKNLSNNSDTRISQKSSQISSKTSILKDVVSTSVQSPIKETNDSKNESPADRASPEHSIRHIIKRRSIFGNTLDTSNILSINASKNSSNTLRDPKQPSFMPGLLSSPFYSGRTMYGGATSSYINYPNIKQRKTATVKESSNIDNTISHSAKQVMELLEQYSTPLTEARRIPQIVKSSNSNISSLSNSLPTYRTQELHVPSFADLLQLKQRSRLIKTTNAARQILASYSSSINSSPYPSVNYENENATVNSNKMTTKVKSRLTRLERGGNNIESSMPSVDLPKGVLQIDKNKLPNLNFGIPVSSRTSTPMQKGHETSTSNNLNLNSVSKDTNDNPFKFSKPSIISESSAVSPKGQSFAFGSPERKVEKSTEGGDKNIDNVPVESQKKWQCSDCWVFNNSDVPKCVCCGGKKVSENSKDITCSICKLAKAQSNKVTCLNCEQNKLSVAVSKEQPTSKTLISDVNQSSSVNNTTDGDIKSPLVTKESQKLLTSQSKWKCGDCWVQNENTSEKCVCCGGKKPSEILVPKDANINILKNDSGADWSCKVCWIKNKMDLNKCLACEADKPDKTENAKSINNIENNFNNIIKTQSSQWECPNCLVKNNKDKLKCICCEEDKPGTERSKTNSFNFGLPLNTSFKFGINPVDNKLDAVKKTDIDSNTENKFKVEETNNNVLTKSTFTFGITPKPIETMKSQDQTDATKEKSTGEKTFTFGIVKPTQTSQIPTSLFGTPQKQDIATNDNQKLNESPNVNLQHESSQENVKLKINPFVLSGKANKDMTFPVIKHSNVETIGTTKDDKAVENYATSFIQPVKDTTQIVPSTLIDDKNKNEEKNTTNPPLIPMPDLTNSVEKSKSGSLPNLFGTNSNVTSFAPTTQNSTTPSLLVFPKTQIAPVTTAPTTMGLFQKPETNNAPLGFGKFSFGNSNQNIKPPGENPSPFTFVNSKIDQSLFKNTFSMPADKNANSNFNKFSSFTGTSTGGGNGSVPSLLKKSTLLSGNSTDTNNALAAASTKTNPTLSTSSALIPTNGLSSGTALQSGSNPQVSDVREIFPNTPAQTEQNIWTPSSNVPKPASFTFGNSSTFNPNNALPTFGATTQASSAIFGRQNNSTNQASIFPSPEPALNHQTSNNVFGLSQPTSNPSLGVGGFSNPNAGAVVPANQAAPSAPSAGPMFSFGNTQRPNVFGFGQGQQQPQPAGVYNFGSSAPSAPQVQFNIGQSDDTKRLKKRAVRRVPQR